MRHAFVTGSAGFIGYHLSARLLDAGWKVTGHDGLTDYYDVALKRARLDRLVGRNGFRFVEGRLEDAAGLGTAIAETAPEAIIHLAAQAGVRYSIENPRSYVDSNLIGSFHVLDAARAAGVRHLLMASTSSVYGANTEMPYRETDKVDSQMSFYAATKKAGEAMSHAWAHIHGLPITQFRFFTVYGPWGRPDMAPHKFTRAVLEGRPIDLYNRGDMVRDFTYVEDLVTALAALIDCPPPPAGPDRGPTLPNDSLSPVAPHRIVNIGNARQEKLMDFVAAIEAACGRKAALNLMPMQPGDVPATWADTSLLKALVGQVPSTPMAEGVPQFVAWFRNHYGL